jgi:hypothetical protein
MFFGFKWALLPVDGAGARGTSMCTKNILLKRCTDWPDQAVLFALYLSLLLVALFVVATSDHYPVLLPGLRPFLPCLPGYLFSFFSAAGHALALPVLLAAIPWLFVFQALRFCAFGVLLFRGFSSEEFLWAVSRKV